jgi:hypothetical protein
MAVEAVRALIELRSGVTFRLREDRACFGFEISRFDRRDFKNRRH